MSFSKQEIDEYLTEIKKLIEENKWHIARNKNREDNIRLFHDYVITTDNVKKILMDLTPDDFCSCVQNRNASYPEEKLYIFGKCIRLLEKYGNKEKDVHLYIKINRLVSRQYVIVVSVHEQKY